MSPSPSAALLQGTVDLLILRTLTREPMHGYGISGQVREQTRGVLGIEDGALYQALRRLERQECIAGEWGRSENNRRARYYQLTRKGRKKLATEGDAWRRYAEAVFTVLEPEQTG